MEKNILNNNLSIEEKRLIFSCNKTFILNKIKHKPIILESIYSFAFKRPYIILALISSDINLKLQMKKIFDKSKRNNDLSTELNNNINLYIKYRNYLEKIIDKFNEENSNKNEKIYKIMQRPIIEENFFDNINVNSFIRNHENSYSILSKKTNLFKNDELFEVLNNFKYSEKENFLKYLKNQGKVGLFLEAVYSIDKYFFEQFLKFNFEFNNYPTFTKKYRNYCKNEVEKNILEEGMEDNKKYKEISITKNILSIIKIDNDNLKDNNENIQIEKFLFDYLTSLEKVSLYNLPYDSNLDNKYLKYISNINIKQGIGLVCIVDRFNYSQFIDAITYPYITSLHFVLFSKKNFDDRFMYYNIPVSNLYNIYMNYLTIIKHSENIKQISFGEEFFINKNQFISYNDTYYQSIISYLIDQYMKNASNKSEPFLLEINLEDIILNEDKLDNIYERFKILYGFNKMFPNLKNKKLLYIKYNDIINNNNGNLTNNKYKIILIDFINEQITDLNKAIEIINSFISKNKYIFTNVEILSFYNFNLIDIDTSKINSNNNNENISYHFDCLPGLKELFINNSNESLNNNIISKNDKFHIKCDKFSYLYLGYDSNDNLIFYRNGTNQIKSIDLLDLFNSFNKRITKLCLVYENITIISNKSNSELKIINKFNNENKFYIYPLKNLSDFIYNYNYCKVLIIQGFDFAFNELINKDIQKLYINFIKNDKMNQFYDYKYNLNDEIDKYNIRDDINLKFIFPNLEELHIGHINDEKNFYKKLLNINNDINISIIISSNENLQIFKKFNNVNVIYHNTIKSYNKINDNFEYEEEDDNEKNDNENNERDEEDNLFYDKFGDEDNIIVNQVKIKNKKYKNKEEESDEIVCILEKKINKFDYWEERNLREMSKKEKINYFKNKKVAYFKSEIISTIREYSSLHYSLLILYQNMNVENFKFHLISNDPNDSEIIKKFKTMNNVLLILDLNGTKIICYNKNNKNNYLNQFILECDYYDSDHIYYNCKKSMIVSNDKQKITNEILSNKFSNIYERYNNCKYKGVELFQIYTN